METTFQSVLELVRHDPSAIVDDSSFDKIIDMLCEICKENNKFLSDLFQSMPSMVETIEQLSVSISSKAASFAIRLLGLCIRYQGLPYQQYTSLLKQSVDSPAPNIVCAVLSVLKTIVVGCDGLCWLLEEHIHVLILNQLNSSSYFVACIAEDVVRQLLVTCIENVIKEQSEMSKACLEDLSAHLNIEEEINDNQQVNSILFTRVMRLASHMVGTSLPAEVLQYLFTNFWSLSKWWGGLATCTAKRCQLVLTFFETCVQNGCANLLEETFNDDSCVLGHVTSLCERDMTLVAMGLLRVAASLLSPSSRATNIQKYNILCKLSMCPLMVYLRNDDINLPRDNHKVVVLAVRQQVLENTEQILLSSLKNVISIVKGHFDGDSSAVNLCVTLLGVCSGTNTLPVVGSLSSTGRHKIITELLIILSQVFGGDSPNHMTSQSVTEQLASCLAELVQKRSFPLQVVCKCLYLIGQVLTTLLHTNADSESGRGLLSRMAESLQLCAMDVNWEIRDSFMELVGSLATEQVSAAAVEFLTSHKLCELLLTRGLVDDESCVKASAMLALSSVMTTPQLVKKFSQTGQLVDHVGMVQSILECTDPGSHDATVRIAAWRAFNIMYKKNKMYTNSDIKSSSIIEKLAKLLPLSIVDDNWEIKVQVMETLMLLYQSLTEQLCTPQYAQYCNGDSDTHCKLLTDVNYFEVLKEAITDYNSLVKEKAKVVVDLLETSLRCGHVKCGAHLVELLRLRDSECIIGQEKTPNEILLDVLQEILMAAKCEESELKLTDCY